jgi:23S rRNA pseudouridine1911/1915/1917 synthase
MSEESFTFLFTEAQPQRLDKFLVVCMPEYSRARLQALIKDEHVFVNGIAARKAGQLLEGRSDVRVVVPPLQPSDLQPEAIPLNIVFENDDLIVVDKPAGMVVHPAAGHASGTLVNAALAYAPDLAGIGGEQRPGVVHRLDRDTSGLILLAKNDKALRWLQDQFRLRKVDKVYLALVDGHPPTPVGKIDVAIGRSHAQRNLMATVALDKGREAVSEYLTLETFPHHALLEVHPQTGRTHQIRLHMQFIGCPVAGDILYGHKKSTIPVKRHFLHAARLTIRLPGSREPRTFEAPLPSDLVEVLQGLRRS